MRIRQFNFASDSVELFPRHLSTAAGREWSIIATATDQQSDELSQDSINSTIIKKFDLSSSADFILNEDVELD